MADEFAVSFTDLARQDLLDISDAASREVIVRQALKLKA